MLRESLIEVGDEVTERQRGPQLRFAVGVGKIAAVEKALERAQAQRTLWRKLQALGDQGAPVETLTPAERTALRALVGRAFARVEARDASTRTPEPQAPPSAALPVLNRPQQQAFETLVAAVGKGFAPFLLQGITGFGKTEVYLRVIADARRAGLGALVLVPETVLTPQLASRFRACFGDDVAVLHSALPPAERPIGRSKGVF